MDGEPDDPTESPAFVDVPLESLSDAALRALIESFVGREARSQWSNTFSSMPSGGWAGRWDRHQWEYIAFFPTVIRNLGAAGLATDARASRAMFVFVNRRGTTLKALWGDEHGWFIEVSARQIAIRFNTLSTR